MSLLRVSLFNIYFVVLTVVLGVAGLWVRAFRRHDAFGLARLWIRLTVGGLRALCGIRVAVIGREHLPAGPVIIASQHRSALDSLIWFTIADRPSYVMKRELLRLPLIGPLLQPAGMIAVDRVGGAGALRRMVRDAGSALANGRQLIIFPEGTRVAAGATTTLAPGIAALAGSGAPIVPVATNSGEAWGDALLMRPGRSRTDTTISVVIEPPLPEGLKRDTLLSEIKTAWARAETSIAKPSIVYTSCG